MIIACIDWIKENEAILQTKNKCTQPHFSSYQISVYTFSINHHNLHPPPPYLDSNQWIIKDLHYQCGYIVIVNINAFMHDLDMTWYACWDNRDVYDAYH